MIVVNIPSIIGPNTVYEVLKNKFWVFPSSTKIEAHGYFGPKGYTTLVFTDDMKEQITSITTDWFSFLGAIIQNKAPYDYISSNPHIFKEAIKNRTENTIDEIVTTSHGNPEEAFYYLIKERKIEQLHLLKDFDIIEGFNKFHSLRENGALKNRIRFLGMIQNLNVRINQFYNNAYYDASNYFMLAESIIHDLVPDFSVRKECIKCNQIINRNSSLNDKVQLLIGNNEVDEEDGKKLSQAFKRMHKDRSSFIHSGKFSTPINIVKKATEKHGAKFTIEDEVKQRSIVVSSPIYIGELCRNLLFKQLSESQEKYSNQIR